MNDIEKQLHEQYSINANSNLATVVSIAAVLLGVIGAYGYVLMYTKGMGFLVDDKNAVFSSNGLLLSSSAAMFVLASLFYISLYMGVNQRKEQFITYAIRLKYYNRIYNTPKIFPDRYTPFGKNLCNFVQGLHNVCLGIYILVFIAVTMTSFNRLCSSDSQCCIRVAYLIVLFASVIFCICMVFVKFCEYKDRTNEYIELSINL